MEDNKTFIALFITVCIFAILVVIATNKYNNYEGNTPKKESEKVNKPEEEKEVESKVEIDEETKETYKKYSIDEATVDNLDYYKNDTTLLANASEELKSYLILKNTNLNITDGENEKTIAIDDINNKIKNLFNITDLKQHKFNSTINNKSYELDLYLEFNSYVLRTDKEEREKVDLEKEIIKVENNNKQLIITEKYTIKIDDTKYTGNLKYTFKKNNNNEYYIVSVERIDNHEV